MHKSAYEEMAAIVARHDLAKGYPKDLTEHDRREVDGMAPGESFLWFPTERNGTHLVRQNGLSDTRRALVAQIFAGDTVRAYHVTKEAPGAPAKIREIDKERALALASVPAKQYVVATWRKRDGTTYESWSVLLDEREALIRVESAVPRCGYTGAAGDTLARVELRQAGASGA